MSKKPILITCQPDDFFYVWQNHLYIESCISAGFDQEQIHILLYTPPYRRYNQSWDYLKEFYPKLNIHKYTDKGEGCSRYFGIYIPILRPHILWQHFEKFPELEKETIIYTDSDILWTKSPDIDKFYDDDVNYMSDASSYMSASYFEKKHKDILEERQEISKTRDFLQEICSISGITKDIVIKNNNNIGGVQYILKNLNAKFWKKVENDIISIRVHLLKVNKEFYKDENKGIQSWCSDLWAVIFNLWYNNREVKIVPELNFTWSSDNIEKISKTSILHNAGIVSSLQNNIPVFYKGDYHRGKDPFKDPRLEEIYNNEQSKTLCSHYYVTKMIELKQKYYNN